MNSLRLSRALPAFFISLALCAQGLKAQTYTSLSKEVIAETAAWFDSLEWPDVSGKPFMEFTYAIRYPGGEDIEGSTTQGFLFAEDENGFTIFCTSTEYRGDPLTLTRVAKRYPAGPYSIMKHRVISLDDAVEALVKELRGLNTEPGEGISFFSPRGKSIWMHRRRKISNYASVFILARCCARSGREDLATRLDAELLRLGNPPVWMGAPANRSAFRNGIEKEIARALTAKAIHEIGDATVTRPVLLAHFQRILRDFPVSPFHSQVAEYAETLRTMIAEDEAHQRAPKLLETMSADEKAREFIFRLRDQNSGGPFVGGGAPAPDSPGEQLMKLGPAAVPALIDALGDKRLTRVAYCSMRPLEFDEVATVGGYARDILWRMSGRDMDREAASAWWKDFQANGEKATLIEGVRAGKTDSYNQAGRLMAIDPKACLEACIAGIHAAESDWVAAELISLIRYLNVDEATAVLRREMQNHKDLRCRVVAAAGLFRRGGKDSVPWVIDEWRAQAPSFVPEDFIPTRKATSLISFLATCGDLSAMRALAERFPKLDPMEKIDMMEIVLEPSDPITGAGAKLTVEVENCAEELGITALADKTAIDEIWRVCDSAAIDLSNRWPERYAFDSKGAEFERDVQIVRMTNIWRGFAPRFQTEGLEMPAPGKLRFVAGEGSPCCDL